MSRYFEELDVAKTKINDARRLDRVGMSDIECPVTISVEGQPRQLTSGKADAFVSLDEAQKGIHMSRLFIAHRLHQLYGKLDYASSQRTQRQANF